MLMTVTEVALNYHVLLVSTPRFFQALFSN